MSERLRERINERRAASATALPAGTKVLRDLAYGAGPERRFDVYLPAAARNAPVIFMVHGGGWRRGDKQARGVVDNKVAHWLSQGYGFVSADYPMLPEADPLQQAKALAQAVARAQALAPSWGANPRAFVLMGHSAGAHLVALLDADPILLAQARALAPRGTVALDSAAMDVVQVMQTSRHPPLYDQAFGTERKDWVAASPYHRLQAEAPPMLVVCSSRRQDACAQGRKLADRARSLGVRMQVLPQDLSHQDINQRLGEPSAYTQAVDAFVRSLAL